MYFTQWEQFFHNTDVINAVSPDLFKYESANRNKIFTCKNAKCISLLNQVNSPDTI